MCQDIAVLVRDVEDMGNVAVVGDVFMRREDIDNPRYPFTHGLIRLS